MSHDKQGSQQLSRFRSSSRQAPGSVDKFLNTLKLTPENFEQEKAAILENKNKVIDITDLPDDGKKELKELLKGKNFAIQMNNCKAGDLNDFAAVSPGGDHVLVWNNWHGRTQQVMVINEADYKDKQRATALQSAARSSSRLTAESCKPTGFLCELHSSSEADDLRLLVESGAKQITGKLCEFKDEEGGERECPAEKDQLAEAIKYLADSLKFGDNGRDEGPEEWRQSVTLQFVNYSKNIYAVEIEETKGDFFHNAFFTIHIDIYATTTNKFIKFKLTDAVGMKSEMAVNEKDCRGFFNECALICIFPLSPSPSPRYSQLPPGWCRPHMEPRTSNTETTYTCTTGWSIGGNLGIKATASGGLTANITASYNQSQQASCTIPEFKVRNISDGSMTGWYFYYMAMDGEKSREYFFKKPISDLARGTLTFNAECVYEGPAGYNSIMDWSIAFEPTFSFVQKKKDPIRHRKSFAVEMKIDMSAVKHTQELPERISP